MGSPLPDRLEAPAGPVLRHWTVDDAEALTAAIGASIEHLRPWMDWVEHEPLSLAARQALIAGWRADREAGGDAVYGMFRDGEVVGGCGLHRRRGPGVLEIGYWVHVDHVRRGIATAAARLLTTAAFADPGIHRVEIHHDRLNLASGAVPRRLGYRFADQRRVPVTTPGQSGEDCRWTVDRTTWTRLRTDRAETAGDHRSGRGVTTTPG